MESIKAEAETKILSMIVEILWKKINFHYTEFSYWMNHILGTPSVIKGLNSKSYTKVAYMANTIRRPISKRFKMLGITKYDVNNELQEHRLFFTTIINGKYLIKGKTESVMLKRLKDTLLGGSLV